MKKNIQVIVLLSIGVTILFRLTLVGFNHSKIFNKNNHLDSPQKITKADKDEKKADQNGERGFKLFESDENSANENESKVIIKRYYTQPSSLNEADTLILNGLASGEFVEVIVEGMIKDFQHVELEWDNQKSDLVEKRVINQFDKIENKVIVIKTYLPEGIPLEKIKWQSLSGKAYEFIISESNLGDAQNK